MSKEYMKVCKNMYLYFKEENSIMFPLRFYLLIICLFSVKKDSNIPSKNSILFFYFYVILYLYSNSYILYYILTLFLTAF